MIFLELAPITHGAFHRFDSGHAPGSSASFLRAVAVFATGGYRGARAAGFGELRGFCWG